MAKNNSRAYQWTFLLYPGDNLAEDYVETLDSLHVEWVESPVHDKDIKEDGTIKKAHIHCVICYDTLKSYNQVCDDIIACYTDGKVCAPVPVRSINKMVRYLAHLDNPEKYLYDVNLIKGHNGFEVSKYCAGKGDSTKERRTMIKDILVYCTENNIFSFSLLVDAVIADGKDEWLDMLYNKPYLFNQYLNDKFRQYANASQRDDAPAGFRSCYSKEGLPRAFTALEGDQLSIK